MSRAKPPKPPARLVVFGSLTLFACLFVVLLFQLSASAKPSQTQQAANAKATGNKSRPAEAEGGSTDAEVQGPPAPEAELESGYEEEPAYEYVEPEYEEPAYEEPEIEYVEPEIEEAPPVVTGSS
jgi:hypothetical protein